MNIFKKPTSSDHQTGWSLLVWVRYNQASMNRQRTSKPEKSAGSGFTSQQILILVLVGLLGSAALALAAFLIFSSTKPATMAVAPISQSSPNGAALPENTALAASTPAPLQSPAALTGGCARPEAGVSQGRLTHVIDGSTIEVQLDDKSGGNVLRVGYAGIAVSQNSEENQPAAQKAHELLNGQAVILVKDVTEQDSAGRLSRYVFAGGRFINFELVRQGLAVTQINSPDQACAVFLQQAQQQARVGAAGAVEAYASPNPDLCAFCHARSFDTIRVRLLASATSAATSQHAREAQACFNACNDYNSRLDDDRDGIACEEFTLNRMRYSVSERIQDFTDQ